MENVPRALALPLLPCVIFAIAGCDNAENLPGPRLDILWTATKLYSQHKEELIIRDFFQDKRNGVFLDVGCALPLRNSTTYYLEEYMGWSGIGIDALSLYGPHWRKKRPNSKFFNYAVTDHSGDTVTFYQHAWPEVSSLSKDQAAKFGGKEKLTEIEVETITLNDLLDANGVTKLDHLTLDIEGAEPGALRGFDIDRFQPELVCIESHAGGKENEAFIRDYFAQHGYERIERYLRHDRYNWYFRRVGSGQ